MRDLDKKRAKKEKKGRWSWLTGGGSKWRRNMPVKGYPEKHVCFDWKTVIITFFMIQFMGGLFLLYSLAKYYYLKKDINAKSGQRGPRLRKFSRFETEQLHDEFPFRRRPQRARQQP